jgi:predicted Zn-dependent peptidase
LAKDLKILEEILDHAMPDENVLEELINDIIRERENRKLNKNEILEEAMMNYGKYGNQSPFTNVISEKELQDLKTKDIIHLIKNIKGYKHRFLYNGPHSENELSKVLSKYHNVPDQLKRIPRRKRFEQIPIKENIVYLCDYDMKQVRVVFLSKSVPYSKENAAVRKLFNEYYDGNMGSVVFQTLRESEGLAYSVQSAYTTPENGDESHYIYAYINTTPGKLSEAMIGIYGLLNEMPESEKCLRIAKESIINKVKTERITGEDILFEYEERKRLGIEDFNLREKIYREVPSLDMEDLRAFFNRYISGRNYAILVLGTRDNLDLDTLEEYGKVRELTLRNLFGY